MNRDQYTYNYIVFVENWRVGGHTQVVLSLPLRVVICSAATQYLRLFYHFLHGCRGKVEDRRMSAVFFCVCSEQQLKLKLDMYNNRGKLTLFLPQQKRG